MASLINEKFTILIFKFVGGKIGIAITGNLDNKAQAKDNFPLGCRPAAIVNGQYPASYLPNTEVLGPDEIRITTLGTGMPNRTKAAASISYLLKPVNGDKSLFDIGTGMLANLLSLPSDFSKIDKVFTSHLHFDHVGDFMRLHIGSWLSGRYTPTHAYGPTGSIRSLGSRLSSMAYRKRCKGVMKSLENVPGE